MRICHCGKKHREHDGKLNRKQRSLFLPIAVTLLLCLLLAGCGAGGAPSSDSIADTETHYSAGINGTSAESAQTDESGVPSRPEGADVKLILRASLVLETTDFEQSAKSLNQLVSDYDGYFENTEVDLGTYGAGSGRRGYYTVRVPREHFDAFLSSAENVCHLVSRSESAEDVGAQYHDTELRVKTLRTKEERLLTLMGQATKMEDIIALEDSLTDVQYEIEQYTTQLNRYDSLIGYSTVNITLSQVDRLSSGSAGQVSFSQRLGAALRDGFLNAGDGLGAVIVLLAYNLVPILILAAVVVSILWFTKRRKIKRSPMSGGSQDSVNVHHGRPGETADGNDPAGLRKK